MTGEAKVTTKAEREYQAGLIQRIDALFGGHRFVTILKNDANYRQGIVDLSIFVGPLWAWLEVKASANAPYEPNQEYYLEWARQNGAFSATIYPENEKEVLRGLQAALGT